MMHRRMTVVAVVVIAAVMGWVASSVIESEGRGLSADYVEASSCDQAAIRVLEKAAKTEIHTINGCPSIADAKRKAQALRRVTR